MVNGIIGLAESIAQEFKRLRPDQRKTQRHNLALLVATMLDVRSANLMDLAAGLPRAAERIDLRYQGIARVFNLMDLAAGLPRVAWPRTGSLRWRMCN